MNRVLILALSVLGASAIGATGYRIFLDQSAFYSPAADVKPMTKVEADTIRLRAAFAREQQKLAKTKLIKRSASSSSEPVNFLSQAKKAVLHPSLELLAWGSLMVIPAIGAVVLWKIRPQKPKSPLAAVNLLLKCIEDDTVWDWNYWRSKHRGVEISLAGVDLSNKNLASFNLSHVDFAGANFKNSQLEGADLHFATLTAADLSNVNLASANLAFADLRDANLSSANLCYATLRFTRLNGANLESANLQSSDASGSQWIDANLNHTQIKAVNFRSAKLIQARLQYANAELADFKGSALDRADFSHANLSSATLIASSVSGTNFSEASLCFMKNEGWQFDESTIVPASETERLSNPITDSIRDLTVLLQPLNATLDALKVSPLINPSETERLIWQIRQEVSNDAQAIDRLRQATESLNRRLDAFAPPREQSIRTRTSTHGDEVSAASANVVIHEDCIYFNQDGYIRCAVNPNAPSCEECRSFESRNAVDE